jgi:hypothetical protein
MDDGVSRTAAAQIRAKYTRFLSRQRRNIPLQSSNVTQHAGMQRAIAALSIHDDLVARIRMQTTVLR